jgi:hypothetical protein
VFQKAEEFSCSLDVLYGGQGIRKLQFLIKKISYFLPVNFSIFVIKTLDLDWIRIGIQPLKNAESGSGLKESGYKHWQEPRSSLLDKSKGLTNTFIVHGLVP